MPNFISAEVNGRTIRRQRHEVVDHRRQQLESVVVVATSCVDGDNAVWKLFDLPKASPAFVFENELKMAKRLDEWNDLQCRFVKISHPVFRGA